MVKDIKTFLRDSTQWSQLFLLIALIVVYLYNFKVLPLDRSPLPTATLKTVVSFANLALAGFVLSAVADALRLSRRSASKERLSGSCKPRRSLCALCSGANSGSISFRC